MAGLFSPATLEQIRAASDIVDVIGSYLPLKRAGANFVALCPFHKEKTPSFNVNPHRQIFHCFGCHKGGDVFTFVKEYENIDFPEAVRRLADRAKIPLEYEKTAGEQQSRHLKERLLQIHEQIAQRWQNALANEAAGQIARDYLARRGVSAGSGQALPPRLRAGTLGRHGQLGEEQRPRTCPGGAGGPDSAQGGDRPLLRPLSRAADVSHLRRAGPGDRLQRAHAVRR